VQKPLAFIKINFLGDYLVETTDLKFIKIHQANLNVFKNLAQAYEAEFSNLTHKIPNELGVFEIDTLPYVYNLGYLSYWKNIPVGFCVINVAGEVNDISEFYIIPAMRRKKLGYKFAVMIFNKHPGKWQIRQIKNAIGAINFWRSVIEKYTRNQYEESVIQDALWGEVTRQRFQTTSDTSVNV
jgi:predicted acetyltransferase